MFPLALKYNTRKLCIHLSFFYFLLVPTLLFSQTITIDDSSNSAEELVNMLINNSCIPVSNYNISSTKSVAYFNNNNGAFPISEGIIIRNGIAKYSEGAFTNANLSSEISTNGDDQLQAISDENGQNATITDVAFLEFDFIPIGNDFNFNFLFASNEYGEWQCSFSDVFAILLTNIETNETTNLAVLPGTNTNISVQNIRDQQYNTSCSSINADLFDTYNVDNATNATLNMRGYTKMMSASSKVLPNTAYKIKFVLGDLNDSDYDSAVFIQSGSFTSNFDLGKDVAICGSEEILLDSGYKNTTDFEYRWEKDGNLLLAETNPVLAVSEKGAYKLTITSLMTNCVFSDEVEVTDLQIASPINLFECISDATAHFNLTQNNQDVLAIDESIYDIVYYNSMENVSNNIPIEESLLTNYPSTSGETIYIKLKNKNTGQFCYSILEFELKVQEIVANTPDNLLVCEGEISVDILTPTKPQILNGLPASNYILTYYTSEVEANTGTNKIEDPLNFPLANNTSSIAIWARLVGVNNTECFDIINFNINYSNLPEIDEFENIYACTSYTLPALDNGEYFTSSDGKGTQLFAGDIILYFTKIYIYNVNSNGCTNESSFLVFIAEEFSIPPVHCGEYIIPDTKFGEFYTAAGGPTGTGTIIPTGTSITESTSIFFYSVINGEYCSEKEYPLTIYKLPAVDSFTDVIVCNSYILPEITNGNFYTESNGRGTKLQTGDQITSSTTIYVYNKDTSTDCSDTSTFTITIIDTNNFQNVSACGSYTIPSLDLGNYYTDRNGTGTIIPSGTLITNSQSVFYYAPEVTSVPNCTGFETMITINPLPLVDSLDDIIKCEDDLPVLPSLANGFYYTQSGGKGNKLNEGETITTSQTIYIYNKNNFCDAETSFKVTLNPVPLVDNFTDVFSCEAYILPTLRNGNYFSAPNGQGTQLFAGQKIETTQEIYIYNQDSVLAICNNENVFRVHILGLEVDEMENVYSCENYILQELNVGNYYTEKNGKGTKLNAGDIITASQEIYIYAENGNRFFCKDEKTFSITIFKQPTLGTINTLAACGSVTLPSFEIPGIKVELYKNSNRENAINPADYDFSELGTRNIYYKAFHEKFPTCFTEGFFSIIVYPLLEHKIEGGVICANPETGETTNPVLLDSKLDETEFTINWYFEENLMGSGRTYEAHKAGTYTVKTIKLDTSIVDDCSYKPIKVVVESSSPIFEVEYLTNDFVDSYAIEINEINNALGNYVYSIDGINFQSDNRFYNLVPGNYKIIARDLLAICDDTIVDFVALKYPKFFTPNYDGVKDTWNIPDLKNDANATIQIFNRYGKLLSIIKPSGTGWNGTNNNKKRMPSADYWFLLEYTKGTEIARFKANFSLLRR
ncbi:choice-of-anchor L domain-containing protein [Polaribacter sp.]|uniref:T9SS type B sorting domain-containing protein n=1 Tax=Polaribacter sp. TaxID=1920175 RepID=UPI003EFA41C7